MILALSTVVHVVHKSDGSRSQMTLGGYHDALNGGLRPEDVFITTCGLEAAEIASQRAAIARIVQELGGYNAHCCEHIAKNLTGWIKAEATKWMADLMASAPAKTKPPA